MAVKVDYAFRETLTNIRRNTFMTLASILVVTVSLYLVGGVLLGRFAINRTLNLQTQQLEVQVFLIKEVTDAERKGIEATLNEMPEVARVVYESKQEAFERFKQLFRNEPEIVRGASRDVLPESFRVKLHDPSQFELVRDRLDGRPGVDIVQDYREFLNQFFGIVTDIGRIGLVLVVLLTLSAAMIIGTTIRLTIFARRKEVAIMKLVGASNWFIRVPFMLEGLVYGVLGTVTAVLLLLGTRPLFIRAAENVKFLNVNVTNGEIVQYGVWLLVAGIFLGTVGSLVGLRRFLEV